MRLSLCMLAAALLFGCAGNPERGSPETRAVAYLVREVPAWSRDNNCFSCHNNGDGARALYLAARAGYRVPAEALADTTAWLLRPAAWDDNKGDPAFSDKRLANIQFAAALQARVAKDKLAIAAERVARDQDTNGSWGIEPGNPVGSPVTYGTPLATYMALRTLLAATNADATRKAWEWFEKFNPNNNVAAAAVLLAAGLEKGRLNTGPAVESLTKAQNPDGGWGPYVQAPSEPFDTAVVLLAAGGSISPRALARARLFLANTQNPDGSWPASTRPPGGDSYAQQVSTAAWALIALLESANLKSDTND